MAISPQEKLNQGPYLESDFTNIPDKESREYLTRAESMFSFIRWPVKTFDVKTIFQQISPLNTNRINQIYRDIVLEKIIEPVEDFDFVRGKGILTVSFTKEQALAFCFLIQEISVVLNTGQEFGWNEVIDSAKEKLGENKIGNEINYPSSIDPFYESCLGRIIRNHELESKKGTKGKTKSSKLKVETPVATFQKMKVEEPEPHKLFDRQKARRDGEKIDGKKIKGYYYSIPETVDSLSPYDLPFSSEVSTMVCYIFENWRKGRSQEKEKPLEEIASEDPQGILLRRGVLAVFGLLSDPKIKFKNLYDLFKAIEKKKKKLEEERKGLMSDEERRLREETIVTFNGEFLP